jgi:hypothetical protein
MASFTTLRETEATGSSAPSARLPEALDRSNGRLRLVDGTVGSTSNLLPSHSVGLEPGETCDPRTAETGGAHIVHLVDVRFRRN